MALAFPNTYFTGMSNLGFQAVYGLFNQERDVVCERFFLPDGPMAVEHYRTGTPLLSLESQRPLADFELVAFSLSHENDYPGLLKVLDMSGLPLESENRGDRFPLILAGGVTVRTNPEPLADFLDLCLIGDGEVIVPKILRAWREVRAEPLPKRERLLFLARRVAGAYAPALYHVHYDERGRLAGFEPNLPGIPEKIQVAKAESVKALTTRVLTPRTEFGNTRLVEIGRGCIRGCRFCLAGFAYRPPRFASMADILNSLGPLQRPKERVGLISPAVADHPELEKLVVALVDQGREVTVSSLRVEALTPGLAQALSFGKMKSASLAPEAGSERLRRFINKPMSDDQILAAAAMLADSGINRIKFYLMLGLPTEDETDVENTALMAARVKEQLKTMARGKGLQPELVLSMTGFVPKAFTPFQRAAMLDLKELKSRAQIIRKHLKNEKGIKIKLEPLRSTYLQALFSRGDRRVGAFVKALSRPDAALSTVLKNGPIDPDRFVVRFDQEADLLPWSFIDHGFKDSFLDREMARATAGRLTPACQVDRCRLCGVCNEKKKHQ